MSNLISGKEALIALANGECVEYTNSCTPSWHELSVSGVSINEIISPKFNKFRLKPHTITINGIEVPAPEKNDDPDLELLEYDQDYWLVDLANYPEYVCAHNWKGDPPEYAWADRGLIHLSKDAALLHAKALILASGGTA